MSGGGQVLAEVVSNLRSSRSWVLSSFTRLQERRLIANYEAYSRGDLFKSGTFLFPTLGGLYQAPTQPSVNGQAKSNWREPRCVYCN